MTLSHVHINVAQYIHFMSSIFVATLDYENFFTIKHSRFMVCEVVLIQMLRLDIIACVMGQQSKRDTVDGKLV